MKWKQGVDPKKILGTPVFGQVMLRMNRSKIMKGWFKAALGNREDLPRYAPICEDAFAHGASFCLASALQSFITDSPQEPAPLQIPSLIIWGEHDKTHRHTDKNASRRFAEAPDFLLFDQSGHFPDLEEPERYSQSVREFIERRL